MTASSTPLRFSLAFWLALPVFAGATTFTVSNPNDDGVGSLRQAILANNGTVGGTNLIQFNIPGADVQTIRPLTELPVVTKPVVIDGYTQPGASANTLVVGNDAVLKIRIDGLAVANNTGLMINADGCVVRGLVVVNCSGSGIAFVDGTGSSVEGCFVGLEADGLTVASNFWGLHISGPARDCRVGGGTVSARNIISGNLAGLTMGFTSGNRVQGNYFGTDASGLLARGNALVAISAGQVDFQIIGGTNALERNVIAANGSTEFGGSAGGVSLFGNSNLVQGNFIGVNAPGTAALGNVQNGLFIQGGTNNLVGGPQPGAGNVLSGNQVFGLYLNETTALVVQGNRIGTSADGMSAIGNGYTGVFVVGAPDLLIGGTGSGEGNQISGNTFHGLEILGGSGVRVQGNRIGTDATGLGALGNGQNGISCNSGGHEVGGTNVGEGNVIAFNTISGVGVGFSSRNRIVGNSIHSNGARGIDLYPNVGPTYNDIGDADTGANELQNFPVLSAAVKLLTGILVKGTLNSQPGRVYQLDFYGNVDCDSSGYGEGGIWLGATNVTTDGSGNVAFANLFSFSPGISFLTATATDPDGNTSEFSACRTVNTNGLSDLVLSRAISTNILIGGQPFAYILTVSNAGPDSATDVNLSFHRPEEVTILDVTVSQGSVGEDGALYISFGTIPTGGTATLTVNALPTVVGTFPDSSSTSSAQFEFFPENNSVSAAITVLEGPGLFKFSDSTLTVREDAGQATVVVLRGGGAQGIVSVDFVISSLTALAGRDFTATNGTLVFANGERSKTFDVPISNDTVSRCDRELLLLLLNPAGGASLGTPATARLLIAEDDITRVGTVEAASLEVNPPDPNRYAARATTTADGNLVAFMVVTNRWPWNYGDVFLRNVTNHTTTLVSASTNGTASVYGSGIPRLSADGRFVAFTSAAHDLATDDRNNDWDVFVRDMVANTTSLASVTRHGVGSANGSSFVDDLTSDGRFVVFQSDASDLVPNDTNGAYDVFLRDLDSGVTELISVKSSGPGSGNGESYGGRVSADGRFVVFQSDAKDLNGSATNSFGQVYVRDRLLGTNLLCSFNTNHVAGNDLSFAPGISANGRVVTFSTYASDLVTGQDSTGNIVAFDIPTRTLRLVTVNPLGVAANDYSFGPVISADGQFVAYFSYADNLVANDNNNETDVFVRDLMNGMTTLVSANCLNLASGNGSSRAPTISADGRFVAFESYAADLVPGALTPHDNRTFRRDLLTGSTLLLSFNSATGEAGNHYDFIPFISADGRTVAFASWSTNLVTGDRSPEQDIYVWRAPAAGPSGTNAVIAVLRMVEGRPVLEVRGGPGTLYLLQRATSLTPPIQWTPLVTVEAPGDGRFEFTDPVPPGAGPAFYRVVRP